MAALSAEVAGLRLTKDIELAGHRLAEASVHRFVRAVAERLREQLG